MNDNKYYMFNRNNTNILYHTGFPQSKIFIGEIKVVIIEKQGPFWPPKNIFTVY